MQFPYDKSSKWLIQHYGGAMLRMAGVQDVVAWRALQAEVVQPRQLPDGLLEVQRAGRSQAEPFIVEVATYPDGRVVEQLVRDAMLVYLDRGVLPEVLTLVLRPRGNVRVAEAATLTSPSGRTQCRLNWQLVELWTLPAEDLLRLEDPGLAPWIPLTQFEGPPEIVLCECRKLIDRKAAPADRENLLAVTQVLTSLRYNDAQLFALLGGGTIMIESPLLQAMMAERMHKDITRFLQSRFGVMPPALSASLRTVRDEDQLEQLMDWAAVCTSLEEFQGHLPKADGQ